jgi:hypothetical protein
MRPTAAIVCAGLLGCGGHAGSSHPGGSAPPESSKTTPGEIIGPFRSDPSMNTSSGAPFASSAPACPDAGAIENDPSKLGFSAQECICTPSLDPMGPPAYWRCYGPPPRAPDAAPPTPLHCTGFTGSPGTPSDPGNCLVEWTCSNGDGGSTAYGIDCVAQACDCIIAGVQTGVHLAPLTTCPMDPTTIGHLCGWPLEL